MDSKSGNELPEAGADGFVCPHCHAYSNQKWDDIKFYNGSFGRVGKCQKCEHHSIWVDGKMFYPKSSTAPSAHKEMPEDVKRDYDEARLVLDDSPRAAAALLRLAIQRLLENHFGADNYSINSEIGDLVEEGVISPRIQRALDAVRVVGNNSVHPGEMNMDDNRETASALFMLINEIVDEAIARDKRIDSVYEQLPEDDLEGIANRDSN
jgi:hypothetical protein